MHLLQHFKELTLRPKNAQELKGVILQLAIQGKLTTTWRKENPNTDSATVLLKKIKETNTTNLGFTRRNKTGEKIAVLNLPSSWIQIQNFELFSLKKGKNPKDLAESVKKYPYQDIEALDRGNVRRYSDDEKAPRCTNDDILVVCDGSRSGLLLDGKTGIVGSTLAVIKTPEFIKPYIKIIFLQDYQRANKNMIGAAIPHLDTKNLLNETIGLPPLEEQKAIVQVVENLFKEVEKLEQLTIARISLKEKFVVSTLNQLTTNHTKKEWTFLQEHFHTFFNEKNNIKKLRETVLQLAVQGKLTADWRINNSDIEDASILLKRIQKEKEQLIKDKKIKKETPLPGIAKNEIPYEVPEDWVWCRFQEVFDIRDGTHDSPKSISGPNSYPLVTSKDFKNGEIDFESAKRISKEDYNKIIQRSLVEEDDILFSMIGGNLGNQVMVKGTTDFAIKNVALFKYYNKSLSIPDFLKTFSEHIAYAVQEKASGGAQPFISLTFLRQMLIPFPPLEEQKAIVAKVNALMGLCNALEKEVKQSQEQSEKLMQSVLREVFETNNAL